MAEPTYDVTIRISRSANRIHLERLTAGLAWRVVDGTLAAWGIPLPRGFDLNGFTAVLAEIGTYEHQAGDCTVLVTASSPTPATTSRC
jgi:hypothetical protein